MDVARTSDVLLAHFEGNHPKATLAGRAHPTLGMGWVLKWAAAMATLFIAGTSLLEFAYSLGVEHTLMRAARAGALEASLPRASLKSITEAVERRLNGYPALVSDLRLVVESNGRLVRGAFQPKAGDRLSIALDVSSRAVMPSWISKLRPWDVNDRIETRVEQGVPGRFLKSKRETSG